jgi:hypothetical protein
MMGFEFCWVGYGVGDGDFIVEWEIARMDNNVFGVGNVGIV